MPADIQKDTTDTARDDGAPDVKAPLNPEKLMGFLVDVVAYICDIDSEDVLLTDDNDLIVDSEGSSVILRINGDSDTVLLTVPWVTDLKETEELLRLLNLINQDLLHGRVYFDEDTIVFETAYQADWMSRDMLEQEIIVAANLDKRYAPGIQERLGGSLICDMEPDDAIEV